MQINIIRDFLGGQWVAKVDGLILVPKSEDGVESIGDLLRWLGDMDDAVGDDESEHTGLADMVRTSQQGAS